MKVRVLMAFDYELPDTVEERISLYGVADPGACFEVDLESDSASTLLDTESTVVSWEEIPS